MAASMTPSDDVHAYSSGKNACPQSVISAKPSQYRHQDQNFLMFDTCTPSLTTGSTRSTASSTSACEHCLLADLDCQCLNHSDLEGMCQQQGYELALFRNTLPTVRGELGKETAHMVSHPWNRPALPAPQNFCRQAAHPSSQLSNSLPILEERSPLPNSPLTSEMEQPSHMLRDTKDHSPSAEMEAEEFGIENSDSEMGEDEDFESESEDEENDWSGHIEAVVLDVLADNLPLAAHLIPILHKELYSEFQTRITRKVGPWQCGVTKCASAAGTSSSKRSSSSQEAANSSTDNHQKKQRFSGSGGDSGRGAGEREDDGDGDAGKRNARNLVDNPEPSLSTCQLRFACPFYKRDPAKYSVQHNVVGKSKKPNYRTCAGPGFLNIQRVKEHLERKHYPVQCGRCFQTFPGADRASLLRELQEHGRLAGQCELKPLSLKEGISDDQWALIKKKQSTRNVQECSSVEKWYEIWAILFPELSKPETPWYDNISTEPASRSLSEVSRQFCVTFKSMLDRQVDAEDIRFVEGSQEEMKGRIELVAQNAFEITIGLLERSSATTSSSARSRALSSLVGSSYENISIATSRTSGMSRSTPIRSQTYAMDVSSSPTAASLLANSERGLPAHSGPEMFSPFIPMSSMVQHSSGPNLGRPRIPNEHSAHGSYPARLLGDIDAFDESTFGDQNLGSGSDQLFGLTYFDFNDGNNVSRNRENLADPSGGVSPTRAFINTSQNNPHLDGMARWN